MSKIENIKPEIFFKFLCGAFTVFFLLYFYETVDSILYKYSTVKVNWSNIFIDIILCLFALLVCVYFGKKLLNARYLFSDSEFTILIFFAVILLFFSIMPTSWHYSNLFYRSNLKVPHIILIIIPLLFLLAIGLYNRYTKSKTFISPPIFYEDNAVLDGNNDILNRKHIVVKLKNLLIKQTFDCSFTIGIIGPWGNGKSSFINLLATEFQENDIIKISFHPYLNHSEAEISSEFFHSLQYALRPYSGKVANLILEYSHKLLSFYSDKNLKNFLKKDFIRSESSAYDTYKSINEILTEINKKILIFIDDLDRLNQEEILQVLKLIRNTANFRNTVFIVAMDKGYVLSRLHNSDSISNNKFIDKFFQLEIHLPEIDNATLKEEFIKLISESSFDEQTIINIKAGLSLNRILFNDHVNNLRDVKRLVNQIIFEFDFVNDEIDMNDFINFIFLKLSFPQFLDLLKRNPENYLEKSGNYLYLPKRDKNKDTDFLANIPSQNEVLTKTYKLGEELGDDKNCLQSYTYLTREERALLIKTLSYLFGDQNNSKNSIKYTANFVRFMQLDYKPSYFLNKNFVELIAAPNLVELKKLINDIIDNKQQLELFHRLTNFDPLTEAEFYNSILIHAILFESLPSNGIYESELLRYWAALIEVKVYVAKNFDKDIVAIWIKENILDSSDFTLESQLKLIGHLWSSRNTNKLWNISAADLEEICIRKFNDYISKYENKPWDVNDFTFYQIYHHIKTIGSMQETCKSIFINYLTRNSIDVFCAQSTDFEAFYENVYKISNGVVDFFGSKSVFINFIKSHRDANTNGIVEYLHFLKLNEITNYSVNIVYQFEKFEKIKPRIDLRIKQNPEISEGDKISQVFFKVSDKETFEKLKAFNQDKDKEFRLSDLQFYHYKSFYYLLLVNFNRNNTEAYLKLISEVLKPGAKSVTTKDSVIVDGKTLVKIYSSQP